MRVLLDEQDTIFEQLSGAEVLRRRGFDRGGGAGVSSMLVRNWQVSRKIDN